MKELKCVHCEKPLVVGQAKYCGFQCQHLYAKRVKFNRIAAAQSGENIDSRRVKEYLLEVDGRICKICGNHEWMGQSIPLIMDHIDGNADNWLLTNLRLVCGNCDMQLPTYKSKNKGKGRYSRRLRYASGKSH